MSPALAHAREQVAADDAVNDPDLAERHCQGLFDNPEMRARLYVHALHNRISATIAGPVSSKTLRVLARFYRAMALELIAIAAEKDGADL